MFSADSTMADSICMPTSVRSRTASAAIAANAACNPATGSQTPRGMIGGPSRCPVIQAIPAACSMVCAKPTRSRHGPSSPNAGIRTMIARGLAALTASHSRSKLAMTRGEKFSTTRSLRAMRSSASARPRGSLSSILTPRLFVLLHRKTGPHSHHCSHVGGLPPAKRMPSGLRTPSIFMTSAPNDASTWVATGPAQKAVKSATLIPASGRVSDRPGSGSPSRSGQCTRPVSSPTSGGEPGARVAIAGLR